jgi:hypothetical protein
VTVTYDVSLDSVVACPVWSGGKIIHNKRPDERPFCYSQYAERGVAAPGCHRMVVATAVAPRAMRGPVRLPGRGRLRLVTGTISGGDNRRTNKTFERNNDARSWYRYSLH